MKSLNSLDGKRCRAISDTTGEYVTGIFTHPREGESLIDEKEDGEVTPVDASTVQRVYKISAIEFDGVKGLHGPSVDGIGMTTLFSVEVFHMWRQMVMDRFGDVDVVVNKEAQWFDKIQIVSQNYMDFAQSISKEIMEEYNSTKIND